MQLVFLWKIVIDKKIILRAKTGLLFPDLRK